MLFLSKTWCISFLLIQTFSPLDTQPVVNNKKISRKDEDNKARLIFILTKRSLDHVERDNDHTTILKTNTEINNRNRDTFIYFGIALLLLILVFLIFCCPDCTVQTEEETSSRVVHRPPLRPSSLFPSRRLPSTSMGSRPLAPPRTSSSTLILLPEDRESGTLFLTIENPNYIPVGGSACRSAPKPKTATPLLDLPPGYEEVVSKESKYDKIIVTKRDDPSKFSDSSSPPKYE